MPNLLAVAGFRQGAPGVRGGRLAVAGNVIRVDLPDSAQLRLSRLHPKATYKLAARTVLVPQPVTGDRLGGAPLRDVELLDWCSRLLTDLLNPAKVPAGSSTG